MRVAFQHTDPAHPNAGVAAYQMGRIQSFTHPITGEVTSADSIVVALLDKARKEFPESEGYHVWPERLSEPDEDDEGVWEAVDEDALRARADGEPVEVPSVGDLPYAQVGVAASQESTAGEGH